MNNRDILLFSSSKSNYSSGGQQIDSNVDANSNTTTQPHEEEKKKLCKFEHIDSDDKMQNETPLTVNLNIESIIDYEYASHHREEKNISTKCVESKFTPTLLCSGDSCLTFHKISESNTTFP